jgi:peptide/nickel transport system permease protein
MLGVLFIVFTISYFTPGDPVKTMLGSNYTPETYAAKAAELGLDKPYFIQLGNYIVKLVAHLDMGLSYTSKLPVFNEIIQRFPVTFQLGILSVLVTTLLGIPIGLISVKKQYSVLDYTVTTFSLVLAAIPNFCFALLAMIVFALNLRWLPASGVESWSAWVLPVLSNSLGGVAITVRMTRTSMLEVIRQDYIRTARAKGLSERVITRKHALKNALIPVVTIIGLQMSFIMAGSVIIESIFSIPGMGSYLMKGISARDYPVINGCVVVLSFFVCVMNLLVDIVYAFIDPRIKAQYVSVRLKKKKVARIHSNMKREVA